MVAVMALAPDSVPTRMLHVGAVAFCCLLSVLVPAVASDCPADVMRAARLCTAGLSIGPQVGPKAFVTGGFVQRARRACRERELSKAVDCLEDLTDRCQGNTEGEQLLRMLVDTARMRISVDNFCNRIHVYERHAPCIMASQEEQVSCAAEIQRNFLTKIRATSNSDVMITSTCRFHNKAMTCSSSIIRERCGNEAAEIVTDMLLGFQPPKCLEIGDDTYDARGSQNDAPGSSTGTRAAGSDVTLTVLAAMIVTSCTSSLLKK